MPNKMDFDSRYSAKNVKQFAQKNEMFKRPSWEPELQKYAMAFFGTNTPKDRPGFKHEDMALTNAAWYLYNSFSGVGIKRDERLLFDADPEKRGLFPLPADARFDGTDPDYNTRIVKTTAEIYGADLVGVTKLDKRWIYSKGYLPSRNPFEFDIDVTEEYSYVISMAVAMDYESFKYSPSYSTGGAVGIGYSRMSFTAGLLAQFLSQLGYKAIASGNDRALSVPIAIQAGLGELGRNGLLITRKYGPRVRLCKVFTNLPLVPDEPIEFGVTRFCDACKKCATLCPGDCITESERSTEPLNISNAEGGAKKWYVDGVKCFKFWAKNGSECGNCIRVCPYNKPFGKLHDTTRWFIEHLPQFNSIYLKADDLFGYGKRKELSSFWDNLSGDRKKYQS